MAFKMKNPSIAKMVKMAGNNRTAMKMKAEEAAMKKYVSDAQRKAVHASKAESAMKLKEGKGTRKVDFTSPALNEVSGFPEMDRPKANKAPKKKAPKNLKSPAKLRRPKRKKDVRDEKVIDKARKKVGDTARPKGSAMKLDKNKEGSYTTHGNPSKYTTASGKSVSSANIDEGNLSAVKTGSDGRKFVVVQDATEKFKAGTKLYLPKDSAAKMKKSPAKMKKSPAKMGHKSPKKMKKSAMKSGHDSNVYRGKESSTSIAKNVLQNLENFGTQEEKDRMFNKSGATVAGSAQGDARFNKEAGQQLLDDAKARTSSARHAEEVRNRRAEKEAKAKARKAEADKVAAMTPAERRKYNRDKKKNK